LIVSVLRGTLGTSMTSTPFPIVRLVALTGVTLLLMAGGCESLEERAKAADAAGDLATAAELYLEAARSTACPDRGRMLLLRSDVLKRDDQVRSSLRSLNKSVEVCPEFHAARWVRAKRAADAGERDLALADAILLKEVMPEAAELYSDLSMELEVERGVRERSSQMVANLASLLDAEAETQELTTEGPAEFARQVPVPMTLRYQVQQSVRGGARFELKWEEIWSYRGAASESVHVLVRTLELPPLARELPLATRLTMSNQRMAMRFAINSYGRVLKASWLSRGPDRGMRPEMLRPEIEGMLKRRRISDPGEFGRRSVGDTWRGDDVRVIDGKPVEATFESTAMGFQSVRGIPTLHIKTHLTGTDYTCAEEVWLHPETAVPVRIVRDSKYTVSFESTDQHWSDHTELILSAVSGVDP